MLFLLTEGTRFTSTLELFGLVIVFIVVIAACYFVTRFVGGRQLAQQRNSNFLVLDTFRLAQNKYLQLVQVGRRYFVIAVGKDAVSLISELEKEDITWWRESAQSGAGFSGILASIRKKQTEDSGRAEDGPEKEKDGSDEPELPQ